MLVGGGSSERSATPAPQVFAQPWAQWNAKAYVVWMTVVGVLVSGLAWLVSYSSPSSRKPVQPPAQEVPVLASVAPPVQKFTFVDPPMLFDVDGDGVDDLVGGCRDSGSDSNYWIGAFDGRNGDRQWRSQDLAWTSTGFRAVAEGIVIAADGQGTVRALNAATGALLWTRESVGVPKQVCASSEAVGITTDSETIHLFALGNGSDLDFRAPHGVCGPIYNSLSGEAPNFQMRSVLVKGELPRHARPSQIPGVAIDRVLVPTTGNARVVLGHATKDGTTPWAAVLAGRKILWQNPIPAGESPYEAIAPLPVAAVRRERLVVPYQEANSGPRRLASFELRSGIRVWDIALNSSGNDQRSVAISRDGQVFAPSHETIVKVLSLDDGTYKYSVGYP